MSASINGMAEKLRARLAAPGILVAPGCYDVLSAMLLEEAGFEAVFLSGYGLAASMLGNPDIGLTSLMETSLSAKNTTGRLSVPVIVDVDNGYGNEENVARTVREMEHAGAAAMVMEDQVFPKRCGHSEGKAVVPLPHYLSKLENALRARRTPLVVVARTDAAEIGEGVRRAREFHAAGADATIIDGLRSREDLERVAREVPGPKQVNLIYGGKTPLLPARELEDMGFKIALYSTPALYAAARSLRRLLARLRESGDLNSISAESMDFKEFQAFIEGRYTRDFDE